MRHLATELRALVMGATPLFWVLFFGTAAWGIFAFVVQSAWELAQ